MISIGSFREGLISAFGSDEEISERVGDWSFDRTIDGEGCVVIPGLVDAHTHPVWAGDRVHEFSLKV